MAVYFIIGLSAFLASALTLFSGFGLGTLLLPIFSVFFPVQTAIALTAVVHLLNNLFKLALLGKYADRATVVRFGVPALVTAFLGAEALVRMSDFRPLLSYEAFGRELQVMPVNLVVAILMVAFAMMELIPAFERLRFDTKFLPLGGLVTGFFGGLSGHQGALRSAFLIRAVPSKESFLGTGIVIAAVIDLARLFVYGTQFPWAAFEERAGLLLAAILAAIAGALAASRLIEKVKMRAIQWLVAVMMLSIALGLASGVL